MGSSSSDDWFIGREPYVSSSYGYNDDDSYDNDNYYDNGSTDD